jgi:hypothetical protein
VFYSVTFQEKRRVTLPVLSETRSLSERLKSGDRTSVSRKEGNGESIKEIISRRIEAVDQSVEDRQRQECVVCLRDVDW